MRNKPLIASIIFLFLTMIISAVAWGEEKEKYLLIYEICNCDYSSTLTNNAGNNYRNSWNYCNISCKQEYQLYFSIEEIVEFLNTLTFSKPKPIAIFKIEKEINFEKQIEKETVTRQEEIIKSERWRIKE